MKWSCKKCDCSYYKRRVNNVHLSIAQRYLSSEELSHLLPRCIFLRLAHAHKHANTLSSKPLFLGEPVLCSDPKLILLLLLSIIQSTLVGKGGWGNKRRRPTNKLTTVIPVPTVMMVEDITITVGWF